MPPANSNIPLAAYEAYRATAQYVSPDGETIQFETGLKAGDPSTTAAMNAVPAIRAEAATVAKTLGATAYGVGGEAPAFYDISQISDSDLVHVVPVAIVVIGLLLCLVMRSLIAPLYLIASVALSYFAALGLSVICCSSRSAAASGLTFILPFLMFIFLLALGEDYNILVMSRIREEAHHLPLREAVSRALGATGTTVTSAGLVLAGTFSVFARGRRPGFGRQPDRRRRRRPGPRRADGHLHRPHRPGAVHGRAARPVELVAEQAQPRPVPAQLPCRGTGDKPAAAASMTLAAQPARVPLAADPCTPAMRCRLVGQGVDRGGQVAQGGCGVAQRGPVALRQRGQRGLDDVLVHPVPAVHGRRTRVRQVQADGAPVAGSCAPSPPSRPRPGAR